MGRRMRDRHRVRESKEFSLYGASPVGLNFVRAISWREGEHLVRQRKARLDYDDEKGKLYFQLVAESKKAAAVGDPLNAPARPSCCVLSRAEALAAAGDFGESATEGLTRAQRTQLEAMNRPAHDFIERAKVKLAAFAPRGTQRLAEE